MDNGGFHEEPRVDLLDDVRNLQITYSHLRLGAGPTAKADRTPDRHQPNPDTPNEGDAHEQRGDAQCRVGRRLYRR
jgi:hypothetical protein